MSLWALFSIFLIILKEILGKIKKDRHNVFYFILCHTSNTMNISFSYPWSFQKSKIMERIFSVLYLCQDPNCFHLSPETKASTVLALGWERSLSWRTSPPRGLKQHIPLFMVRLFSQLNKTGKTDVGLATFPTPPLEKGLSHEGCALFPSVWKRCLWDPRKQPLLTLAGLTLRE